MLDLSWDVILNSLQIDYINAKNQEKKIDQDVNESKARTQGLNYGNAITLANMTNLDRKVRNDSLKYDMDNAMLDNTTYLWVNGGKRHSNMYNRRWNPYWDTKGNMGREFFDTVNGIKQVLSIPAGLIGQVSQGSAGVAQTQKNINTIKGGFIN